MKSYASIFLAFLCLSLPLAAASQQMFEVRSEIDLPDSVLHQSVECVDIDNDGLLDVAVFVKNNNDACFILFYRRVQGTVTFQYAGFVPLSLNDVIHEAGDVNLDGRIDFLVSGRDNENGKLLAIVNEGSFTFSFDQWLPHYAAQWLLVDTPSDNVPRLLATDVLGKVNLFEVESGDWNLIDARDATTDVLMQAHLDDDGEREVILNGQLMSGPVNQYLIRHPLAHDEETQILSDVQQAVIARGDVNYNGIDDLLIGGEGSSNGTVYRTIRRTGDVWISRDTLDQLEKPLQMFLADFTSDGKLDIGILFEQGTEKQLKLYSETSEVLGNFLQQNAYGFGDMDRDGDLDLVRLGDGHFTYVENVAPISNEHPTAPRQPVLAKIFDRLFLSWERAADDHTPVASITYDVLISSGGKTVRAASFDRANGTRLRTSEGNNGTLPFLLVKHEEAGEVAFRVQSVDNSFYGGPGGICQGQALPCEAAMVEELRVCGAEKISVSMPTEAKWYSFSKGYLGKGITYEEAPAEGDTLFAVTIPVGNSCPQIKVVTIQREIGGEKTLEEELAACEGEVLELKADEGWSEYTWSSTPEGVISEDENLSFTLTKNDTLTLTMSDGAGCSVTKTIAVVASAPELSVAVDSYQILKGGSVQLVASGASSYAWSPASGLDDPFRRDPVAMPERTTTYTVTGKDSLGCAKANDVLVRVEETAFIPQLFTPNNDGTNDVLKIYGLGSVSQFVFTIYNREGGKVFSTADPDQVTTRGWDGWSNGVLQPAGVYHWKVEGTLPAGAQVSLNGKVSGSVMLVR